MLFNDLVALLMQTPPILAAQWGAWFVVGLVLSIWSRREKARLVMHGYDPSPRPKSGVKHARPVVRTKASAGDAFGELEAILEPQEGTHRMPGELPGGESPVLRETQNAPVLAAPQSLP